MPSDKEKCCVPGCNLTQGLHEHHVIPRAYGGLNGPTVIICGGHHTLVHDVSLKNRSDERELMLANELEESRPQLRELVFIIRKSRIASKKFARPMQFQTTFDAERAAKVRELKQLLGVSSLQSVVERCIDMVYTQRTPLKKP